MTKLNRQPNMYDVAKLAQVSHQTVSRVVNNYPSMRPETRARVVQAMDHLGYRPNQAARALVTQRSRILGILASDLSLFGPSRMLQAMELASREHGHMAVSCTVDPDSPSSVAEGINHLADLGIDGLVVLVPQTKAVASARKMLGTLPVVTVDSMYRIDELSVSVDNFAGGQTATEHLISLGHRNILHISGPKSWFEATARSAAHAATMLNVGFQPQIVSGDWTADSGYAVGLEVNFEQRGITAVFAANDYVALGVIKAAHQRGIRIPQDLSVVGFDDVPESGYFIPSLTTMRQDFSELGRRAIRLLLSGLDRIEAPNLAPLIPDLIVRESTSAPRAH
jgi:DNA-binding LacI/PurR family transcriptional regulator